MRWFEDSLTGVMQALKRIAKKFLRQAGFGLWKIDSTETLNFENLLYSLLRNLETISFIHVGAHDGKSFTDPLYHFVMKNPERVSGVMVEPVKETYTKLVANIGHVDSVQLLNVAIHPTLQNVTIYKFSPVDKAFAFNASGLASTDKNRFDALMIKGDENSIHKEEVSAITMAECLNYLQASPTGVDVICIDTEGLDFELIRSLDFDKIKPYIIRFEHNLCTLTEPDHLQNYASLVELLNKNQYQVFTEHNDAVAVSNRLIPLIVLLTEDHG